MFAKIFNSVFNRAVDIAMVMVVLNFRAVTSTFLFCQLITGEDCFEKSVKSGNNM